MQKRNSPVVFIVAGLAVVLLVGFNVIASNNRPRSEQELQAEESRRQAEAAQKATTAGGTGGAAAASDTMAGNELALLDAETVSGNPKSPTTITIGWRWTPDVQGNPSLVYSAVEQAQKFGQNVPIRLRIVNLDAVANGNVPEGVSVGGKTLVPLGADGGLDADATRQAMMAAMKGGGSAIPQKNSPETALLPVPTKQ